MKSKAKEWWSDAFEKAVYPLEILAAQSSMKKQALRDIAFLQKKTRLKKGAAILDLACGVGRHSIPMAQKGFTVTGVDISPAYLLAAKRTAKRKKLKIDFVCQDMRKINFKNQFDVAVNLWTSFGYFKNEKDDVLVLKKIHRSLKPNGFLMLELINGPYIFKHALKKNWHAISGGYILEEIHVDKKKSMAKTHWIFLQKNKKGKMLSSIRLYTRNTLSKLLKKSGFKAIKVWGATDGSKYVPEKSFRLVVIAKK